MQTFHPQDEKKTNPVMGRHIVTGFHLDVSPLHSELTGGKQMSPRRLDSRFSAAE